MGKNDTLFNPVKMLKEEREVFDEFNFRISPHLEKYTENFHGLRKMNEKQIKLYTNDTLKPTVVPPRPMPYHSKATVDNVIESIIKKGVVEKHPPNKTVPWVSCAVIVPKSGSSLQITLDARDLNKVLISNKLSYPSPTRYNNSVTRRELL